ncbi:MAG TPA: Hsp20/alpha crystallin family protein [Pseudonocardiaceae bacterium]
MAIGVGSVWDPFTALVRQVDAEFDALVRRAFGSGPVGVTGFVPAADMTREGSDVVITLELPGVDVDKDVDVEVAEGRLTISGRRSEERSTDGDGTMIREIRTGEFRREFALPEGVTADQVDATYDRGLLRVRVRDVVRPAVTAQKVRIRSVGGSTPTAIEGTAEERDTRQ